MLRISEREQEDLRLELACKYSQNRHQTSVTLPCHDYKHLL